MMLKKIIILAVIYCVVGPLLLLAETAMSGTAARTQAGAITFLAVFFFTFSFVTMRIHQNLQKSQKTEILSTYYLAIKMIRLLLSAVLLVLYGFLFKESTILFAANLVVFYLITAVYMSIYFVKQEKVLR